MGLVGSGRSGFVEGMEGGAGCAMEDLGPWKRVPRQWNIPAFQGLVGSMSSGFEATLSWMRSTRGIEANTSRLFRGYSCWPHVLVLMLNAFCNRSKMLVISDGERSRRCLGYVERYVTRYFVDGPERNLRSS